MLTYIIHKNTCTKTHVQKHMYKNTCTKIYTHKTYIKTHTHNTTAKCGVCVIVETVRSIFHIPRIGDKYLVYK